jgi:sulfatase modifying factor 1
MKRLGQSQEGFPVKNRGMISRRDFLHLMGVTAAASSLGACSTRAARILTTPTEIPSIPSRSPTAMPTLADTPTAQASPVLPEMVLVEPGQFQMGSREGAENEQPVHTVKISRTYFLGIYPVTRKEYAAYCADIKKCSVKEDLEGWENYPVSGIDWYGAVAYCNWLSEQSGLSPCYSGKGKLTKCDFHADGYRLPTEAEWEFAARGGVKSRGYAFAGSDDPDAVGWHAGNSGGASHPAGEKKPNELGIYDMSGNRWEWCWDWYDPDYYAVSPDADPLGPETVVSSVDGYFLQKSRRSSSALEEASTLRVSFRSADGINYAGDNGFRLSRSA